MGKSFYVSIPLLGRPCDLLFIIFFTFNLFAVTYIIDLESLIIENPRNFKYPAWPLPVMVDITHWWGKTFDPALLARPVWWRATIWIDVLFFGPFYVFALYAFIKGRDWIREPSLVYSGIMFANVFIIMMEEMIGPNKTHSPVAVWLANLPWFIFPIVLIGKMWLNKHPFTRKATNEEAKKLK